MHKNGSLVFFRTNTEDSKQIIEVRKKEDSMFKAFDLELSVDRDFPISYKYLRIADFSGNDFMIDKKIGDISNANKNSYYKEVKYIINK